MYISILAQACRLGPSEPFQLQATSSRAFCQSPLFQRRWPEIQLRGSGPALAAWVCQQLMPKLLLLAIGCMPQYALS